MDREGTCCLCGDKYARYGHNPAPLGSVETERCCDTCNDIFVVPVRMGQRVDSLTAPTEVVRRYLTLLFERLDQSREASTKSKK